ncbi:MAG: glutamate--tRNA ligase [Nanoarchaeota archaeon]
MDVKRLIEDFALENAVHHDGKANPGSVIAKVIGTCPEHKDKVKEWSKHVGQIVAAVNKMTILEQTEKLKSQAPDLLEKKEHEKKEDLKPLPNVDPGKPGQVVMRVEPSPSGLLHLGHTFPLILNSEYVKMYRGKLIIRISDTNPDNILPDAYKFHLEDSQWLTEGSVHEYVIQSDRMESYYAVALTLLERGHAYICECAQDVFKEGVDRKVSCPCRDRGNDENIKKWHRMFLPSDQGGYDEGDAVYRLKTDICHKNPAMRDFPLLRICDNEHPRQGKKYRVWPLMNLAVAVDDHELGLTHVIRGKDHYDNTMRQLFIYDYLGWKAPEFIHTGRVKVEGMMLSKSKTSAAIEEGVFTGWDDIRLPVLRVLKRRGYQPKAFVKFVRSFGVTLVDKRVEASDFFKSLNFFNREIIEPIADRFFFVEDPKEIEVSKAPSQKVTMDLHPDLRKGGRSLDSHTKFYITKNDLEAVKDGKLYRLMHCLNFTAKKGKFTFHSQDAKTFQESGEAIFHWLSVPKTGTGDLIKVKLVMDDASVRIGLAEPAIAKKSIGDIVQFERVCFARYDHDEDGVKVFWYAHR